MNPRSTTLRTIASWFACGLFLALVPFTTVGVAQVCPDRQPYLTVQSGPNFRGGVGVPVHIEVTAIDYDGDAITSFIANTSGLPPGNDAAFLVSADHRSGSFTWTPQAGQTGNYNVTFIASNALTGSAAAHINVVDTGGAPFVQSPALLTSAEGQPITFTVYAGDPDGEPIQSLTAAPLPTGASFAPNMSNTAGGFSWTPGFTQAGSFSITFTAVSSTTGSSTTNLNVINGNQAPVVTAPPTVSGTVGTPLSFNVSASAPPGDIIATFTMSSPGPPGATFIGCAGAPFATGQFSWTPTQTGFFTVTFVATTDKGLAGAATTSISVSGGSQPVVTAPATVVTRPGALVSFVVTASASSAISSLTAAPLPTGATFTASADNTSGTFNWVPSSQQFGMLFNVTFTAISNGISGSATTGITVGRDQPPTVTAPATVSVMQGQLLTFTVTAVDPENDPIISLTASPLPAGASFAPNLSNTAGEFSWTPSSSQAGTYTVQFAAADQFAPQIVGTATTTINVSGSFEAVAFAVSKGAIKLASGRPFWCAALEIPPGVGERIIDLQPETVVMRSPGTGTVDHISAVVDKSVVVGDQNGNNILDMTLCFRKEDLRLLFASVSGRATIPVTLEGTMQSGNKLSAPLAVDVVAGGGHAAASISPNPLNPSGVLRFDTSRAGDVLVRLFDTGGRMVRQIAEKSMAAGSHEVRLEARDGSGRPLASGIYYFRVDSVDGVEKGRVAVLK